MVSVHPVPAFNDNYIWHLSVAGSRACCMVDPGDAQPALQALQRQNRHLEAILITHHHSDHLGGVEQLLRHFPECAVFGPAGARFPMVSHPVGEGDRLQLLGGELDVSVVELPGHTLDHIGYITNAGVFCGDTLFSAGCGRLFEGSPAQLHASLGKLRQLPEHTPVYCAHEYTAANLRFALRVEPDNPDLLNYQRHIAKLSQQGLATLPTTIGRELSINPFLRTGEPGVRAAVEGHLGRSCPDEVSVLAGLREWKDNF